jgi:hypothetical protein
MATKDRGAQSEPGTPWGSSLWERNLPGDVTIVQFTWTSHPSEVLIMGRANQRRRLTCAQGLTVGGTHEWCIVGSLGICR